MIRLNDFRFWLMTLLGVMCAVVILYYSRTMIHGFVLPRQALLIGIGWLFLLLTALVSLKKAEIDIRLSWLHIFYGLFVLMGFASALTAIAPEDAMIGALRYAAALALMVGVTALFIAPQRADDLAAKNATDVIDNMMMFVLLISVAISLCAALTISQYYNVDGWWKVASNGVGGAIFGNKNMASDAYSITFLIPLILFWSRYLWMRLSGIAMFALISYGLLLTTSKGAFFGMMLGLAFMVVLVGYRKWPIFNQKQRLTYLAVPILLVAVFAIYMQQSGRFAGMLSGDNSSLDIRLVYWQNSTAAIKEHALLGVGVDNYPMWHNKYSNAIAHTWTLKENFRITHLHNDYLQAFADQGIPGGVAYTLFWAMVVWLGFIAARSKQGAWPIVVAGALVASFGNSLFNFAYHRPTPVLFLGILAGLLVAAAVNTKSIKLYSIRAVVMIPLSIAMLVLGLLYNVPFIKADKLAAQGTAFMGQHPQIALPMLEQSLKLRPSHQSPVNNLIAHYLGRQDYENGMRILENHALRYDPFNPYTLRVAAEVYLVLGNYDKSNEYLERIRSFMPTYESWYDSAIRLAYVTEDHAKALRLSKEAFEKNNLSNASLLLATNSALSQKDIESYQAFIEEGYKRKVPQIMEMLKRVQEQQQ